jgi:hypothetical protein
VGWRNHGAAEVAERALVQVAAVVEAVAMSWIDAGVEAAVDRERGLVAFGLVAVDGVGLQVA